MAMPTNTPQDATVRTGGPGSVPSAAPVGSPERAKTAQVLKRKAPQPREQGATLPTPMLPAVWTIGAGFVAVVLAVLAALIVR